MIKMEETSDGKWLASCSHCGWRFTQPIHTRTMHVCTVTGERVVYTPPDWESRSWEDRNPGHKMKMTGHSVDPRVTLKEPSLVRKAVNFTEAAARYVAAGRPETTDEQVTERFAICQACPLYKPKGPGEGVCTHPSCGCSLKAVGLAGKNKLRWLTESCPTGKWQSLLPATPGE